MFCSIKRSTFRTISEILCWVNLGVCAYYGYVIGNAMGQPASWGRQAVPGHPIEGLLIGALIGLITSAVYGGFVAALLRIDEKCENGSCQSTTSSNYTSVVKQEKNNVEIKDTSWYCKKCGGRNSNTLTECAHCNAHYNE